MLILYKSTEHVKAYQRRLRVRALMFLGGMCEACAINDMRVLHIDHTKNNGSEERRMIGRHENVLKRVFIAPADYKILCANCHMIKHSENENG